MKSILISIRPKYCELIAKGKKTIEVRKTKPKIGLPFKCYIYCTKDGYKSFFQTKAFLCHNRRVCNGKVIGEFVCDKIIVWTGDMCPPVPLSQIQLTYSEIRKYGSNNDTLYLWQISDLKIYDKPRELSEFGLTRPPQSWCYVDEKDGEQ